MKYGIGITTRNRPHVLNTALQHFSAFPVPDSVFVIVDDASELDNSDVIADFLSSETYPTVVVRKSPDRLGIAKAKNSCLGALRECEHVFLFDDDCWPIADGWAQTWADINMVNGIQHSMFNVGMQSLLDRNPAFRAAIQARSMVGTGQTSMVAYNNCFGVMLYFTRDVLDAVGGYATDTPTMYGYEHAQMSKRIGHLKRFTGEYHYWTPWIATDLLYSVDISYCMLKLRPPIDADWLDQFKSSVSAEEMGRAEENSILMNNPPTYIDLDDPFELIT